MDHGRHLRHLVLASELERLEEPEGHADEARFPEEPRLSPRAVQSILMRPPVYFVWKIANEMYRAVPEGLQRPGLAAPC